MRTFATYFAALTAAFTFAISAVMQQRAARQVPEDEALRPGMVKNLLHRRAWLAGVGTMILAYVLQAIALGFGDVAVVEPIVASELIFAVPIAVRRAGERPGRREWVGIVLAAGGVATFLIAARPVGGVTDPDALHWVYGFAPWAAIGAVLVLIARAPEGPRRAGLLGAAAGVSFGLLSLITKSAIGVLTHHGFVGFVTTWQTWILLVVGAGGFFVSQSAYQAAPLASSLPIMDAVEPISAVVLSGFVLGEHVSLAPLDVAVEIAGALATVTGIFLLGRSPLVLSIYESTERRKERGEPARRGADTSTESGVAAST